MNLYKQVKRVVEKTGGCIMGKYADYTEVETIPKLFIKANSLKRFQISFSA